MLVDIDCGIPSCAILHSCRWCPVLGQNLILPFQGGNKKLPSPAKGVYMLGQCVICHFPCGVILAPEFLCLPAGFVEQGTMAQVYDVLCDG